MPHKGFNPNDEKDRTRLWRAVQHSRRELEPFRKKRSDLIRQYVGSEYPKNNGVESLRVPANLIELMMTIYITYLAANAPRVLVTTIIKQLKILAADFGVRLNELVQEIKLAPTLQAVVQDALLRMGIVDVYQHPEGVVEYMGEFHDVMQPHVDRIDLDDWVHDVSAKTYEQVAFAGHRYRLPLDVVRESGLFDKKAVDELTPKSKYQTNEGGDERIERLARQSSSTSDVDEYRDYIELYDIWLPIDDLSCTFDADNGKKLAVVDYDGPEGGRYKLLTFHEVPNNIMPLSPVGLRKDMHDLANNVWRKLDMSARDQKDLLLYAGGSEKDVERILAAGHQQSVKVDHINNIKEMSFNGPNQILMALSIMVSNTFKEHAGNLDALGGIGPLGDTATESSLLSASASKRVAHMQQRVTGFTKDVLQTLAWYEWTEPLREKMLTRTVPGTTFTFQRLWSPETREGDFIQYDIDIEPFSMQPQSPAQKSQALLQLMTQVIIPLGEMLRQQGQQPNIKEMLKIFGKYNNLPELQDILIDIGPQQMNEADQLRRSPEPRQSPVTTRTNVRINRPGTTRRAQDDILTRILAGGGVQPSEGEALTRQVG